MGNYFDAGNYIRKDKKIQRMLEENNGQINDEIISTQLEDRGISYDKNNKIIMNSNQFIRYVRTRTTARQNAEGIWFYNYTAKHYDLLTEDLYKKIFFGIIEEASEDVWKVSMEKQYIAYFKNKVKQFKSDRNAAGILQFNNGILDFSGEEVKFLSPSPRYFCNFRLPYDYDEKADCPRFKEFLNDIFEDDDERVQLIQEIMGACLYYGKCMQYLVVFLGNGSNGKSLLATLIKKMLGEKHVSAIALDQLSGNRFSRQNLDRKLLNISSETKVNKIYSTADLKTFTGGDSVEIEKKFKDSYTTEIYAKFILLTNDMIQTEDYSDGFYRRLLIIPFNQHYYDLIPGEEPDPDKHYRDIYLEDTLAEELPGIFNFAFDGFLRLWGNSFNFSPSSVCEQAKKKYKNEHNIVKFFLNECMDIVGIESRKKVKASELFPRFESFCRQNHSKQLNNMTKNRFFKLLDQIIEEEPLDVVYKKGHDSYYYVGMQFKN